MDPVVKQLKAAELILLGERRVLDSEVEVIQQLIAERLARASKGVDISTVGASGLPNAAPAPANGDLFAVPKVDPVTGEPVYDPRVVRGYKTHRQRARALARVYGPVLRGSAAGRAIFEAGETNASTIASAVANLNVLAKHKVGEFTRESGIYTYHGDVDPDLDMIALVSSGLDSGDQASGDADAVGVQVSDAGDASPS